MPTSLCSDLILHSVLHLLLFLLFRSTCSHLGTVFVPSVFKTHFSVLPGDHSDPGPGHRLPRDPTETGDHPSLSTYSRLSSTTSSSSIHACSGLSSFMLCLHPLSSSSQSVPPHFLVFFMLICHSGNLTLWCTCRDALTHCRRQIPTWPHTNWQYEMKMLEVCPCL